MYVDIIALSLKCHRMLSRFWKQPAFKEWNLDSKALQPNNDIHDFTLVIDKHPSNKVDVAFSQCRMHSILLLITLWSTVIYTVSGLSWFPWSTHWGLHWRYTLENLDSSVCVVFWVCGYFFLRRAAWISHSYPWAEIRYSATMLSIRALSFCLVGCWHKRYPEMRHLESHVRKRCRLMSNPSNLWKLIVDCFHNIHAKWKRRPIIQEVEHVAVPGDKIYDVHILFLIVNLSST